MRTRTQPAAARFWAAIGEGRFELPRCGVCSAWQEPDADACERCGSSSVAWEAAPRDGVVFSTMEPLNNNAQQVRTIVVVDMDAGPRMMGVVEGARRGVPVGMRVAAVVPGAPGADRLPLFAESATHKADA